MRRWRFSIYRTIGDTVRHEMIEVIAKDSFGAVDNLPAGVVSWDFAEYEDGAYSQPVGGGA